MNTPNTPDNDTHYRLAIRRPVATAMLFVTLLVFGWKSYQQLQVNLMPDISYPTLTVRTEYEGAAPQDVEKLVTRPLEELLSSVGGLVEVSSISSAGLSEVILEFTWDTSMNVAQQDVRDQLDVFTPPEGVTEKPVILRYDPTLDPVIRVAVYGHTLDQIADAEERLERSNQELTTIREAAERALKPDLESQAGIAQVAVKGGREEEIQILVDAQQIKNLQIPMARVVSALSEQNINLSGGSLKEGKTEYLVRTLNEFETIEQIRGVIVASPGGRLIQLQDVALVRLGRKDRNTIVHVNGREAVALEVYKEGDANTVQVCNTVKRLLGFDWDKSLAERVVEKALEAQRQGLTSPETASDEGDDEDNAFVRDRLPSFAQLNIISDQSRFIVEAIKEVQQAMLLGGLFALIVLFFFLRELRATLVIGVSIPISVVATFVPLFLGDVSLNIMSLGGLALGVGMLVDNSIVVLESIFRCREEGDELVEAANRGTNEVGAAVTASTLTTIAVFFPIAFVEGVAGQIFGDLALAVTFSLIASLMAALYLIPMIASRRPLSLGGHRPSVWVLRAYYAARNEKGKGPMAAAGAVVPLGLDFARAELKSLLSNTFGPVVETIRRSREGGAANWFRAMGALIVFPILCLLFLMELLLRIVSVVLTTVLFILGLVAAMIIWGVARVLRVVLWVPLYVFDKGFRAFRSVYVTTLRACLRFAPALLFIVGIVAVHAWQTTGQLGQELIPSFKQGQFGIRMEAPAGTRLDETAERAIHIETIIVQHPMIESVTVEIGSDKSARASGRSENIAEFTVLIENPEKNAPFQDRIVDELRRELQRISSDDINFTEPVLFTFKTAIEVQVLGDDLDLLRSVSQTIRERIADIPGLKDAETSMQKGYPEIVIEMDRDLLAAANVSPYQVAQKLRSEVRGDVATRFSRRGEKIDVLVRSHRERLNSVEDLRALSVVDRHPPVPLESVASIRIEEGPSEIRRVGQRRVAFVTANISGRDLGSVSRDLQKRIQSIGLPRDFEVVLGGQKQELEESYGSLQFALLLAIFLVYVVMACQFESFWHPALVMFSVPLAFIGVIYALVWLNIAISVVVFIGGIILAGIVVNDAIVLVDYINQLRRRGLAKTEAIVQAGNVRLRPIIMTTVTTVLGLVPMAIWTGEGAEIRRPMAITVMAGLTSATILTLIVIPVVYHLFGGRDK